MQSELKRINELQGMISNCEDILNDEMAQIMLGDDGIEIIKYLINHYKEKI
jgi:hypothetical protein